MFKQAGMRYTDNISQCICGTDMFDYIPAVCVQMIYLMREIRY